MLRRAFARKDLLVTLLLMTFLTTFALTASRTLLAQATESALLETISGAPQDAQVLLAQTRYTDPAQVEAGTKILARALPGAQIRESWRTPALLLKEFTRERLTIVADPAALEASNIVVGEWPSGVGEAAIHELAAESLDLSVGDQLTLLADGQETRIEIVGVWRPHNPNDPIWGEDLLSRTGVDSSAAFAFGPALVLEQTLTELNTAPFIRWQIHPTELASANVSAWLSAIPELTGHLADAGLANRGITLTDGLRGTLANAQESITALRSLTPIPYSLFAVIAALALWQIFTLLRQERREETVILQARGASLPTLLKWSAGETAIVTAVGSALGISATLVLVPGSSPWLTAALVTLGILSTGILAGLPARAAASRSRNLLAYVFLGVAIAWSGISLWRLLRSHGIRTDALAVTAPAATLVAVAAIAILGIPLLLGLAARLLGRTLGLSPSFELRQASRRHTQSGIVVLIVVLAATIGVSTTYWGTWQNLRETAEQVNSGADLVINDRMLAETLQDLAQTPGVTNVGAVFTADYLLADGGGELTGLTAAAYAASSAPSSVLDPGLAESLTANYFQGPSLDGDEITVEVRVGVEPEVEIESPWKPRTFRFWVVLWNGEILQRVELGEITTAKQEQRRSLAAPVPPLGPWQVVAVDSHLDVRGNSTKFDVELTFDGLDFTGFVPDILPPPIGQYTQTAPVDSTTAPESTTSLGFTATLSKPRNEFELPGMPTLQRFMVPSAASPIPIATTPGWAGPQTETAIRVAGVEILTQPVASLPVIPGNPSPAGILVDTAAITHALMAAGVSHPTIDQAWVSTDDLNQTLQEVGTTRAQIPSSAWAALSILIPHLLLALTALSILIALPAIWAATLSERRSRRSEVVILRALGASARTQVSYRRREFTFICVLATVIGALAGGLLTATIAGPLIRSTTPQASAAVPLDFHMDLATAGFFFGSLAIIISLMLWWYGRRIRVQVHDLGWREAG